MRSSKASQEVANEKYDVSETAQSSVVSQCVAQSVGLTGFELSTKTRGKLQSSSMRSNFVAMPCTDSPSVTDLTGWLDNCPIDLSEPLKADILAMINQPPRE